MTLVLTELTPLGIAMAADSAVTFTHPSGLPHAVPNAAEKLQRIPYLNAGVSCWGIGEIGGTRTDVWLRDVIQANNGMRSLAEFAQDLANRLNSEVGPSPSGECRLGFHLAGFEEYRGQRTQSFFHIHDGPSTALSARGITVDPTHFNANHDVPPEAYLASIAAGRAPITRNGDYQLYAALFALVEAFFGSVYAKTGIVFPRSAALSDRAEYLVFQIRTVSEIYRLSNLIPGIGGAISFLTIAPTGLHSFGVRY